MLTLADGVTNDIFGVIIMAQMLLAGSNPESESTSTNVAGRRIKHPNQINIFSKHTYENCPRAHEPSCLNAVHS